MFDLLYGNDKLKKIIGQAIESDLLAHAYIIEGRTGSGKHTLAYEIAVTLYENSFSVKAGAGAFEELFSELPVQKRHQVLFDRFLAHLCPDVKLYSAPKDRKTIGVDTVRDIFEFVSTTPNELDFKVLIVESADNMTLQAQNALLKLLEEPLGNVYFFLLCQNAVSLIPTVRSRSALLRMESFSDEYLTELFLSDDVKERYGLSFDEEKLKNAVRLSDGTVGSVVSELEAMRKGKDSTNFSKISELTELISDKRSAPLTAAVIKLPSDRSVLVSALDMLEFALRDLLYVKTVLRKRDGAEVHELPDGRIVAAFGEDDEHSEEEKGLLFYKSVEDAERISVRLDYGEISSVFNAADIAIDQLRKNGNMKLILVRFARALCVALRLV